MDTTALAVAALGVVEHMSKTGFTPPEQLAILRASAGIVEEADSARHTAEIRAEARDMFRTRMGRK